MNSLDSPIKGAFHWNKYTQIIELSTTAYLASRFMAINVSNISSHNLDGQNLLKIYIINGSIYHPFFTL
jgi:hypothetical protein